MTIELTALQRRILELALERRPRGGLNIATRPNRDARDLLARGLLVADAGRWRISDTGAEILRKVSR